MKLLSIDTSTAYASVALSSPEQEAVLIETEIRQHAQCVLPMIQQLLVDFAWNLSELDGIVFGRGPGSFTGLRIACSIAKGLAYAHNLPLFPVSSLMAIANEVYQKDVSPAPVRQSLTNNFVSAPPHSPCGHRLSLPGESGENVQVGSVLAVLDARMQQLYWACYNPDCDETEERVEHPANIQGIGQQPLILAGVGFEAYLPFFSTQIKERIIEQKQVYPNALSMADLVRTGKITSVDNAAAAPIYIRNQVTQGEKNG